MGAKGADDEAGIAYVYQRSGTGTGAGAETQWELKWTIVASDSQREDSLGYAVAIADTRIVVSAPGNDDNGLMESGQPHCYSLPALLTTYTVQYIVKFSSLMIIFLHDVLAPNSVPIRVDVCYSKCRHTHL